MLLLIVISAAIETVRRDVISEGNIGRNHANNDGETGDMSPHQDPVINSNLSPSCLTPFLFAKKKDPNLRRQVSATRADIAQHESLPHGKWTQYQFFPYRLASYKTMLLSCNFLFHFKFCS